VDCDYTVDFSKITSPSDRVAVIATAPLTSNESWSEFKRGQLLMFDNGCGYSELHDCMDVEQQGRGLSSNTMPKACGNNQASDIPAVLRSMVNDVMSKRKLNTSLPYANEGADLGCGTGCSGLAFRSCVNRLTGVDISPEMVDRARLRGCYDDLLVGDIESVLRNALTKFDIIFASNVFVYIEDINGVFSSARRCLSEEGGVFAFSVETIDMKHEEMKRDDTDKFRLVLQSCARYAHDSKYIEELSTEYGFSIDGIQESHLRWHDGKAIKGVVYVMTLIMN
jgi:predicted TPR repeat methyltransferase